MFTTAVEAVRRPRRFWATVRIDWHTSWRLQTITLLIASWLFALAPAAAAAENPPELGVSGSWLGVFAVLSLMIAAPYFIAIFLITESRGAWARLRGRRDGSQLDKPRSSTVTAHASAGWLLGGMLAPVVALGLLALESTVALSDPMRVHGIGQLACVAIGAALFFGLTRIGYRELEFANSPGASPYSQRSP